MSIINQMHEDLQKVQQEAPILAPMPKKNKTKKMVIILLSVFFLSSSLGLSYLIFIKKNKLSDDLPVFESPVALNEQAITQPQTSTTPSESNSVSLPTKASLSSENMVTDAHDVEEVALVKPVVEHEMETVEETKASEKMHSPATKVDSAIHPEVIAKEAPKKAIKQQQVAKPVVIAEVSSVKKTTQNTAEPVNKNNAHLKIKTVQLSNQQLANIYLKEAKKAEQNGDNELAAQKWQKALLLQPQLNEIRKSLALYYYSLGEVNKATNLLKEGAVSYPDFSDFNLMLSRIASKEGDLQKAYLYLDQNPPSVQGNLDYHVSYAILAQKFELFEKSEKLYLNLLTQRPKDGRWRMSLAIAQDKQGKIEQAVSNYQIALSETSLSTNAKDYINQRLSYLAANSGTL